MQKDNSPNENPPQAPNTGAEVKANSDDPVALAETLAKNRVENLDLSQQPAKAGTPPPKKSSKKLVLVLILVFILLLAGGGATYYYFLIYRPAQSSDSISSETQELPQEAQEESEKSKQPQEETPKFFSRLTGEPISSEAENSSPTYCVQIPNGVDGARPQVGLTDSKVVFEAIAEAGITRFAAIFQNPPAVIGPIRSLRIYYLNWDTPFDCTVVHAGGADDAIAALKAYGSRDLSEDYNYMWRSSANANMNRLWNNLFTSANYLKSFNDSRGYLSSDIKSFPRFTPSESKTNLVDIQAVNKLDIDEPSSGDTNALAPKITHINFHFGDIPNFNPVFDYDAGSNTYRRSYETGAPHESYDCAGQSGEITPELACSLKQISPSVVIAMIVQERRAAYDNYHEDISSIGAGDAYIFQNGDVIKGTWEKSSPDAQIIFRNENNEEVKLAPGQTWISAVPAYGSVSYQ